MILAAVDYLHYMFMIPLAIVSVFLTLVILVQRGRGGGLTGALGGMGGASAFGTKAGDLFTKITIAVAFVWIVLSMASLKFLNQRTPFSASRGTAGQSSDSKSGDSKSGDAKSGETKSGGKSSGATSSSTSTTPKKSSGASSPAPSAGSGSKPATTTP